MKAQTRQRLNAINQRFYAQDGAAFSRTRQAAWPGFAGIWEALGERTGLAVLDVGCGNGRLCGYLEQQGQPGLRYHGVDNSEVLLGLAARQRPTGQLEFSRVDLVADSGEDLPPGPFDLITAIGLLHHIPGAQQRRELLHRLARLLAPGGILAVTVWRFDRDPRFARRVRPWTDGSEGLDGDDLADLEPGDTLLGWGTGSAVRYCHFPEEHHVQALFGALPLQSLASYHADGLGDRLNDYHLLGRPRAGVEVPSGTC